MSLTDARVIDPDITAITTSKQNNVVFADLDQLDILSNWHANDFHDQVGITFWSYDIVDIVLLPIYEHLVRVICFA